MDLNKTRSLIEEKFNDINFIEESHQYFIGEDEYTPVSNIISEFEPYVNWNEKADDVVLYKDALCYRRTVEYDYPQAATWKYMFMKY